MQRKGFGALLSGVFHVPYPNPYRCPYGKLAGVLLHRVRAVSSSANFSRKIVDPEEVAAIVVEPIQGEGGYIPAPAEFLLELQSICRRHGILLVTDEVQSGMGRTGKWWAGDHAGIEPDIVCVAKGIASGMPLSATIARGQRDGLAAGRARLDLRRQSRLRRRRAGHVAAARRRVHRKRAPHGRISSRAHGGLARASFASSATCAARA